MKAEKKISGLEKDQLDLSSVKGGRANVKNALLDDSSKFKSIGSAPPEKIEIGTALNVKREERIGSGGMYPPKK